jgi:hypothetical protein
MFDVMHYVTSGDDPLQLLYLSCHEANANELGGNRLTLKQVYCQGRSYAGAFKGANSLDNANTIEATRSVKSELSNPLRDTVSVQIGDGRIGLAEDTPLQSQLDIKANFGQGAGPQSIDKKLVITTLRGEREFHRMDNLQRKLDVIAEQLRVTLYASEAAQGQTAVV